MQESLEKQIQKIKKNVTVTASNLSMQILHTVSQNIILRFKIQVYQNVLTPLT